MIQELRNALGRMRWRLRLLLGKPARSVSETMFQINRLTDPARGLSTYNFQWGPLEYVATSNLRAQYDEIFVRRQYAFVTDKDEPCIVDCGANIGLSVIWFKNNYPKARISAYEADPEMAARLTKNLSAAGITDVAINARAVWIHDGEVSFDNAGEDRGAVKTSGSIRVPAVDIANCLPDHVDLLKLDVEGAEFGLVKRLCQSGAISKVENIVAEFHVRREDIDSFVAAVQDLRAHGMEVAMTAALGPWLGRANASSPFEAVQLDQGLIEVFAWRQSATRGLR